jgi:hypothetical protein
MFLNSRIVKGKLRQLSSKREGKSQEKKQLTGFFSPFKGFYSTVLLWKWLISHWPQLILGLGNAHGHLNKFLYPGRKTGMGCWTSNFLHSVSLDHTV